MLRFLITTILFLSVKAVALQPFKAEYKVFKDGKEIGASSIELQKDSTLYKIIDKTKGTHGLASFLGFKRSEVSLFEDNDNHFIPDSYQMQQKVAFKKRHSEYQVDAETQMVYGKHKSKEWQIKQPKSFTTPNLVSLNLARDVCEGKTENLNYTVLKRGKLVEYQFKITAKNKNIIEVDKIHSKPTRITKTWLDTQQKCIPVKTYHKEEDEDPLESKLKKVAFY